MFILVMPLARVMLLRVTTHDVVLLMVIMVMQILDDSETASGLKRVVRPNGSMAQSEY